MPLNIEFLVEELSTKEALLNLLPKMIRENITFDIHPFSGKDDLIKKLPNRLKGYKTWMPPDYKIVVLIDEDRSDCLQLKHKLESIAANAGFLTKTAVESGQTFQVLNRLVVEELEAWFFGDVQAIVTAYPRISTTLANKAKYRNCDAITGGTWECLERVLQKAGYHLGGLEKVKAAQEISKHMNPQCNQSPSFQTFRNGLISIGV